MQGPKVTQRGWQRQPKSLGGLRGAILLLILLAFWSALMNGPIRLFTFLVTAVFTIPAGAGVESVAHLFSSHHTLELRLTADFRQLVKDGQAETRPFHSAVLVHADQGEAEHSIGIRVQARGGYRSDCKIPPLMLDFSGSAVEEGPFAGQLTLPLATHCRSGRNYGQYTLQEYLIYRLYNLLSDKGLGVRLARMTYVQEDGRRDPVVGWAFFVEHFDALAARVGGRRVTPQRFDPFDADAFEMGLLEVFQYMIGNTDWSAVYQHNILLIQPPGERVVAVPFDFDWAGVISAHYAHPDPKLGIRSVRQRLFRGRCRSVGELAPVFRHVEDRREAIYRLYREQVGLEPRTLERTLEYYDQFYATLASPPQIEREIVSSCVGSKRP